MEMVKTDLALAEGFIPSREAILELERHIAAAPQFDFPIKHHFAPGLYAREMFVPAGCMFVGKIHRHAHLYMVASGDITLLTEHGVQRIQGPRMLNSVPGIKRTGYAHEDTVLITYHPTDETDLDKIEAAVIAPSFEEFDRITQQRALKSAGVAA